MDYTIKNIERDCQSIIDICKGAAASFVEFYQTDDTGKIDFSLLIDELMMFILDDATDEENELCRCFFKMCAEYLEAACRLSDKVFLSFKMLSQIELIGNEQKQSVFKVMIDTEKENAHSENVQYYLKECEDSYALFLQYASKCYEKQRFIELISLIIERFLEIHNLGLTNKQISSSSIKATLNMAVNLIREEYKGVEVKEIGYGKNT